MALKTIKERLNLSIKPEILGGAAQLALVASILLDRFTISHTEFIQGMLIGFSVVGNIAWLLAVRKRGLTK